MPCTSRVLSCMSGSGISSMPAVPFWPGTTVIARTSASSHPAVASASPGRGDDGQGGDPDDRVMASSPRQLFDVVVVGAGPAGVVAALRAARLGASTALITRDQFGGMAANDGPVPVRTLAQAARLIREARQLPRYGIASIEPSLDYPRLLARVGEVTAAAREQTLLRDDVERAGVRIYEQAGPARFADAHTVESDHTPRLQADRVIICTGGSSRPLPVPGFDLTATHSDAWNLSSVPPSLLVIGAGATGVQVASIFNAFGSRVHLVEIAPRILMSEDHEVSQVVGRSEE